MKIILRNLSLKSCQHPHRIQRHCLHHVKGDESKGVLSHIYYNEPSEQSITNDSIVFMHGILGSKKNFRTVCKEFALLHPHFQTLCIDHRAHGVSPTLQPPHTVESCALDAKTTLEYALPTEPTILCGHSFGGKVVLKYLQYMIENDQPVPAHTWILDSLPGKYNRTLHENHQESVISIVNKVASLPKEFPSKDWVIKEMISQQIPTPIALWIATNLIPVDESIEKKYRTWKFSFDIETILLLFDDFCTIDMWDFIEDYNGSSHLHFLRAGKNKKWTGEILARFDNICKHNPYIHLHHMPNVGHWLHAEDTHGMLQIISKYSNL